MVVCLGQIRAGYYRDCQFDFTGNVCSYQIGNMLVIYLALRIEYDRK